MAGYYPSAYDVYDDIYELDDSPPPSPPRRDGGGDRYPDPPKGAYEAPYSKPPMPNSSNGQGSYSRRSPSPVSLPPVAQDQKPQDPIVIDLEQEPAISPPPGAAKPRSRHSPSQDRYRDRSPDWRGSRYRDYGRNESRSSRYRDRSPSDSPPRRYGDRRRSRSDRSPPSRRRSPDYYRRRRSRSRSRSPRRYSPGRRRRYSRSPDRRRRRSSSQSEQEAPKAPEPEPVPAWMQALAQSGMIPQSMVSGGSRPPMLICGYIPGATPTPQFQATTPALVGLPAVSSKKILPQPEPEPEEPEEPAQPEPPSYPLVPMATTLKTGSCKASVRLMRFMLDSYEAPVLPAADPTLITTPQPVNNRRGIIRFEKGMQCPVPGCQPGSTFLTTASFAMHWIALHCESIKQIKCRLCKNNTVAVWGHPLVHLAHVHGISSDYANMNLFMNKTKIYRNHFISPRGFTFDVQNYIEEYNYLQTDNGTYATFEIYCPVFVSFKPGMPCPVTLCPHNLNYTKFEDLVAHWNLVHQEDCYYYVCQHCLKHPLVARYYVTIRAESMQEHMLKEHPYAASEPLVQEMLLNPAYIPPGRHRFLLANQRHNHERNKWLQRCHCTEQRPRRQRTPFTDPTNTCPTHSGPLVEERSDEAAESSAPKEPEIINFTAGMVCPVEKCPSRQKRAYQREGEFAMHWTRMHKPSRHYACTRCKHTIKYMEGMLDTNAENNAACYHYKTEHKTHAAHWKKGYKLEYCPMVDPGHLRY